MGKSIAIHVCVPIVLMVKVMEDAEGVDSLLAPRRTSGEAKGMGGKKRRGTRDEYEQIYIFGQFHLGAVSLVYIDFFSAIIAG